MLRSGSSGTTEPLSSCAAGVATAWRYVDGTVELLAAWAPGLHEALAGLGEGDFVSLDGR